MGRLPDFGIHERTHSGGVRLTVVGELDLASTPLLEQHLMQLRADRQSVTLDLSELEFIDSSGVHLLFTALRNARADGWHLEIEPDVTPAVRRVLEIVSLDGLIVGGAA